MVSAARDTLETCPFIDEGDSRCASHFRLDRLTEALSECVGGYRGCAHYWRIARGRPEVFFAQLTAHGRPLPATGS